MSTSAQAIPGLIELGRKNQAVVVGDLRMYNGTQYRCRQAHTTQAGWEPTNVPALWEVTQ